MAWPSLSRKRKKSKDSAISRWRFIPHLEQLEIRELLSPTVIGVSPNQGPTTGGTLVTVTGTEFVGVSNVYFGAGHPASFTVVNSTTLNATAPAGPAGIVDITVVASSGTSAITTADRFTYIVSAVPSVSGVTPNSGPTAGGTVVSITGSNFTGTTIVSFGGTNATNFTVVSSTQISATSPSRAAGLVDILVTNASGTSSATASDRFTYTSSAPTITGVNPNTGSTAGGTVVTITGTNFTGATAVSFGGTAATSFTVNSATQITATSPARAAGLVDITVTTPGGTSSVTSADQFTYGTTPNVTGVSPSSGSTAGGTVVTITGTNFTGATAVSFGGTAATSFTVNSATLITATAPAHAAGLVDVRITTPSGTSGITAADQFTYVGPPSVTAVSPNSGSTAGGTTVVITGSNFTGATAVSFGGTAATSFTVNSATQITAVAPAHAAGVVDVVVTTSVGSSSTSSADQFTYTVPASPPSVTAISPNTGSTAGGTVVTITGSNFTGATAVSFGGTAATSFTVDSATQITATAPARAAGVVDVTVTSSAGTSSTSSSDQFTYVAPVPSVTAVSPNSGSTNGGTVVTITGTNVTGATAVSFGGTAATSFTVNSSTQITATSPARAAGVVDITVTSAAGTSSTSASDQFTYIAAPTIASLSPSTGPTAGGTTVVITGTNLTGATAVSFGGTAATSFTVDSATQVTATAPAHAAGVVFVAITTGGGTSASMPASQYTYVAAPAVTAVNPATGPVVGGTMVTITGSDFTGATAVSFGGTAATSFTVMSASQITATAPAHAVGVVDVTVTTAVGTSATSTADQFTYYVPAPVVTMVNPLSGPTTGGQTVFITGSNFSDITDVFFGSVAAASFTVTSSTQISAVSPAHAAATVDVTVVSSTGGTSATSAADRYTFAMPPIVNQQFMAVEGMPTGLVTVATFASNAAPSQFTATIDWGDSQSSAGTIDSNGSGSLAIKGDHTYLTMGTYQVAVTLTDSTGSSSTNSQSIQVLDAPLVLVESPETLHAVEGTLLENALLVTFRDTNIYGSVADYTVTVNWGDGSTTTSPASALTIDPVPNTVAEYRIFGDHLYTQAGAYLFTVTIHGGQGPMAQFLTVQGMVMVDEALITALGEDHAVLVSRDVAFSNMVVAAFTDANIYETEDGYQAQIDWGDGTTDVGEVESKGVPGSFRVKGSHTYLYEGEHVAFVTIQDNLQQVAAFTVFDVGPGTPLAAVNRSYTGHAGQDLLMPELVSQGYSFIRIVTDPASGRVFLDENGVFTYEPDAGFTGTDSFSYAYDDRGNAGSAATVSLTITNAAPQAQDASYSVEFGGTLTVTAALGLAQAATDADQDSLTFWLATAANGQLQLNPDGSFSYTPPAGFTGMDSFTYQAFDGTVFSTPATVTITVTSSSVQAGNDSYSVHAGATLLALGSNGQPGILANDSSSQGTLVVNQLTGVSHGSLFLNRDGTFSYTSNPGFVGTDSFTYQAFDGGAFSAATTVAFTVTNGAPTATADAYTVQAGFFLTTTTFAPPNNGLNNGLLVNDSDPDGDPLAVNLLSSPSHGRLSLLADGSFTYTPHAGYTGSDSFTYQVFDGAAYSAPATVTFTVVNDAPVAAADAYTVQAGVPLQVTLSGYFPNMPLPPGTPPGLLGALANDSDANGNFLSVHLLSSPEHGRLSLDSDGTFTYLSDPGFTGTDSFTYQAFDGAAFSAAATVTFTVTNTAPVAVADLYQVPSGGQIDTSAPNSPYIGILFNDSDADGNWLTVTLLSNTQHGFLTLKPDGSVKYTPRSGFAGTDSFIYQAFDGVALSNPALVTIVVAGTASPSNAALNTAPFSAPDGYGVHAGGLEVDGTAQPGVLANDSDAEGNSLQAILVQAATQGSLILNSDGTFLYRPRPGFVGEDSFTYRAADGMTLGAVVSVRLTVTDTAPAAADDAYMVHAGSFVAPGDAGVLANDTEVDGDGWRAVLVSGPSHGRLILNSDGTFLYAARPGFVGTDQFTYKAFDGLVASNVATVRLVVTNTDPVAKTDGFAFHAKALTTTMTNPGFMSGTIPLGASPMPTMPSPAAIAAASAFPGYKVLDNDLDADGDVLQAQLVSGTQHGALILNSDGTFIYMPHGAYVGDDTFSYQVFDGSALSPVISVRLVVTNTAPVSADDILTVQADRVFTPDQANWVFANTTPPPVGGTTPPPGATPPPPTPPPPSPPPTPPIAVGPLGISANVLSNDSDVDGDKLRARLVTGVSHGTLVLSGDGTYAYTPARGYTGSDSFAYQVSDGVTAGLSATVYISVIEKNLMASDDLYTVVPGQMFLVGVDQGLLVNDMNMTDGPVRAILESQTGDGRVALFGNGAFIYLPPPGFVGTTQFTYRLTNDTMTSAPATVTLGVAQLPPVAVNDYYTVSANAALAVASGVNGTSPLATILGISNLPTLTRNDQSGNGAALQPELVSQPVNGTLQLLENGGFLYVPNNNFVGVDSFQYVVSDGVETSAPATVTISVTNTPPVAVGDAYNVAPGQSLSLSSLTFNDYDAEGNRLNIVIMSAPTKGSFRRNPDNTLSYWARADATGTDSFTYRVYDGMAHSNVATVTIGFSQTTVGAVADVYSVAKDTPLQVLVTSGVLLNDTITNANGATLTASVVQWPANGVLTFNSDGSFTYTPNNGYVGVDWFQYRAAANGAISDAVVFISVYDDPVPGPSKAMWAKADRYEGFADQLLIVPKAKGVAANDSESSWWTAPLGTTVGEGVVRARVVQNVGVGALDFSPDGAFVYQPLPGWTGTVTFTYAYGAVYPYYPFFTPPLSVAPQATPPPPLTPSNLLNPYTSQQVRAAHDTQGATRVTIEIQGRGPVAKDDRYQVSHDQVLVSPTPVLANDLYVELDPDTQQFIAAHPPEIPFLPAIVQNVQHGTLNFFQDGTFTYRPDAGFIGTDSFTYRNHDGITWGLPARVNITVVDNLPFGRPDIYRTDHDTTLYVAQQDGLLSNDQDLDEDALSAVLVQGPVHGSLTFHESGAFYYIPDVGFTGTDRFLYRVRSKIKDPNGVEKIVQGNLVPVTIQVTNAVPVAKDDSYTLVHDQKFSAPPPAGVLSNDFDPNGDPITLELVDDVAHGQLTLNPQGSFTYMPDAGFFGTDLFTYRLSDGFGGSRVATVALTVTAALPQAQPESFTLAHDTNLLVPLQQGTLANDMDAEGNLLTAGLADAPARGTLDLNPTGSFTYTPDAGFIGTDLFVYQSSNGQLSSKVTAVTLNVTDPAPQVQDDSYSVIHDSPLLVPNWEGLLANDVSPLGGPLVISIVSGTAYGSLTVNAQGSFLYLPSAGFVGTDVFTYRVSDGLRDSRVATVRLNVSNAIPQVNDFTFTIQHDSRLVVPVGGGVLSTAGDGDGDRLTANVVSGPQHGALSLTGLGSFTYVPDPGFVGIDAFVYQASDGIQTSRLATVTITVSDVPSTAAADSYRLTHGTQLSVPAWQGVLANDVDVEGDRLHALLVQSPAHGTLTLNDSGSFTYTPAAGFTGLDTFFYRNSDGLVTSDTATVRLIVTNEAPEAENDSFRVIPNTTLIASALNGLLRNDSDPDGDWLGTELVSGVSHGTLNFGRDGTFSYTPNAGFTGYDTFAYRANDGVASSNAAMVTILVGLPRAADDAYRVAHDRPLVMSTFDKGVLGNDLTLDGQLTSASLVRGPSHGSLTLNSDGTFTYTPNAAFTGTDTFTYMAHQGPADSNIATVTLAVANAAPVGLADSFTTHQGQTFALAGRGVLANDGDADGDTLTAQLITGPSHGVLNWNTDGTFTYAPEASYLGTDTIVYRASDGLADSGDVTVTLTVVGPAAAGSPAPSGAPMANPDYYQLVHDRTLTLTSFNQGVLANDSDPNNQIISAMLTSGPQHGSLQLTTNGTFTYVPDAHFVGIDTFIYATRNESLLESDPVKVTISVTDNPPVGSADFYFVGPLGGLAVTASQGVLRNDYDADGDPLTALLVSGPEGLTLNPDGSFAYIPPINGALGGSFIYQISDGVHMSAPITVGLAASGAIAITSQSQASQPGPGIVTDIVSLPVNAQVIYRLVQNGDLTVSAEHGLIAIHPDPEGDKLAVRLANGPSHGHLQLGADGSFSYVPDAGFTGTDSFAYQLDDGLAWGTYGVQLLVTPAPVAVADNYRSFYTANQALVVSAANGVLANDHGPAGVPLYAVLEQGLPGLTLNADGSFVFDPLALGNYTFTYRAVDGRGDSASATVTIHVGNESQYAADDHYRMSHDRDLEVGATLGVLANDSSMLNLPMSNATLATGPAHGSLTFNANGSFTYTPDAGFVGADTFTYQSSDGVGTSNPGTVYIVVGNDGPTSNADSFELGVNHLLRGDVLDNDHDLDSDTLTAVLVSGPNHGAVSFQGGSFAYIPELNFTGTDSFTYRASDGLAQGSVVTVRLNVASTPQARDDVFVTAHGISLVIPASRGLLANDVSLDGEPLAAELVSGTTHGQLHLSADGAFTYVPNGGFSGADSFTYRATDGHGTSNTALVTIQVVGPPPAASMDAFTVHSGQVLQQAWWNGILANDLFQDHDSLTVQLVTGPNHGTLSLTGTGDFTYTPASGFAGLDSFSYQVSDGQGASNTAVVILTVADVAPVALADSYSFKHDTALNVTSDLGVLANDTDADGDALTAVLVSGPAHGILTLTATGAILYTPNIGYFGSDSFIYKASDGALSSPPVVVAITVTGGVVQAVADSYTVQHDRPLLATAAQSVLANDVDNAGDPMTASVVSGPAHGTLTLHANGTFTYVPTAGYVGVDTFTYAATDLVGGSAVGTVTLTVTDAAPQGQADTYGVLHDGVLAVLAGDGVLKNDTDADSDPLAAVLLTGPAYGTLTLKSTGAFLYLPDAGYVGGDSFTYQAFDGYLASAPVTVTLNVTNATPSAQANTYTVPHDTSLLASSNDGVLAALPDDSILQPSSNVNLQLDTSLQDLALGSVKLKAPSGNQSVLANDSDANGDRLKAELVQGPANGTLTLAANGAFLYVPNPGFKGTDTFSYRAWDGAAYSDPATVTINVTGNDFTGQNNTYRVMRNGILSVSDVQDGLLHGDLGPEGGRWTVIAIDNVQHGTLNLQTNGTFLYRPNDNYLGADSFTYAVLDGSDIVDIQEITLNVTDDKPTAANLAYGVAATITGWQVDTGTWTNPTLAPDPVPIVSSGTLTRTAANGVLAAVKDANGIVTSGNNIGDTLSAVLLPAVGWTPASGGGYNTGAGTLVFNSDGSFTYTSNAGFTGTDTFRFLVYDGPLSTLTWNSTTGTWTGTEGWLLSDPVTVTLTVTADAWRAQELNAQADYDAAKGSVDRSMSVVGRVKVLQQIEQQFTIQVGYAAAVRAAEDAEATANTAGAQSLRDVFIAAEDAYGQAQTAADLAARTARQQAQIVYWISASDLEVVFRNSAAAADQGYQNASTATALAYQTAVSAADAMYQTGLVTAAAAHDLALGQADTAFAQAESQARATFQSDIGQVNRYYQLAVAAAAATRDQLLAQARQGYNAALQSVQAAMMAAIANYDSAYNIITAQAGQARDQGVAQAQATYSQAVAAAGLAYSQGADDRAGTAAWSVADDPTYMQAVAAAQAAMDASLTSLDQVYTAAVAAARLAREAAVATATAAYDAQAVPIMDAFETAVTAANVAYDNAVAGAQSAQAAAVQSAHNAYDNALSAAQTAYAVAVQATNQAVDAAELTARNIYQAALHSAEQVRDVALETARDDYEADRGLADAAYQTASQTAFTAYGNILETATLTFDQATGLAEQNFQLASWLANQAFDLAVQPHWSNLNNTMWGALQTQIATQRAARQAYANAGSAAEAAFHAVVDPLEQNLFNQMRQANSWRLTAYRLAMIQFMGQQRLYDNASITGYTLSQYRQAQQAYALATATADRNNAQFTGDNQVNFITAIQSAQTGRAVTLAQAEYNLLVSTTQGDLAFTTALAYAAAAANAGLVQAWATATQSMAQAARDQAVALAQASQAWQQAAADAGRTLDGALIAAGTAWQNAEAAANEQLQIDNEVAWAAFQVTMAQIGKVLDVAVATARQTWLQAVYAAAQTGSTSVASAAAAEAVALAQAQGQWEQDVSNAAAQWITSVSSAWATMQTQLGLAQKTWLQSVAVARRLEANAKAQALADWEGTATGAVPLSWSAAGYDWHLARRQVGQARAASANAWDSAQNTAWSNAVLAQAQAWQAAGDSIALEQQSLETGFTGAGSVWQQAVNIEREQYDTQAAAARAAAIGQWAGAWASFDSNEATAGVTAVADAADAVLDYLVPVASAFTQQQTQRAAADVVFASDAGNLELAWTTATANAAIVLDQAAGLNDVAWASAVAAAETTLLQGDAAKLSIRDNSFADADQDSIYDQAAAEKEWTDDAWTGWQTVMTTQATNSAAAIGATQLAEAQAKKDLVQNQFDLVQGLVSAGGSTPAYTMLDQAQDIAQAQGAQQLAKAEAYRDKIVSQADKKLLKLSNLSADSFANVSLDNPTGQPPPPPRTKSNDNNLPIEQQLLRDLDRASRLGLPATVGMLRIYGGGNMTAHQALSQAAGLSLELIRFGMNAFSVIPGLGVGIRAAQLLAAVAEGDASGAAWALVGLAARISPCGRGSIVQMILRGSSIVSTASNVSSALEMMRNGNAEAGYLRLMSAGFDLFGLFRACFPAGTKLMTQDGLKPVEQITESDRLLSRSEFDLHGPLDYKPILETFTRTAPIWNVHVGKRLIRTTAEHPFYVLGKGWIPAAMLEIGDLLSSHEGQWLPVEGVANSGQVETVYNFEVADYHTYFVGGVGWEFSVWVHNANPGPGGYGKKKKAAQKAKDVAAGIERGPGNAPKHQPGHRPKHIAQKAKEKGMAKKMKNKAAKDAKLDAIRP